ncbi:uncharacterized protein F5Z01DRAFT_748510 [Emericellopsis atlantica]|uniref:Uncharacterized protein n=1 Tax=Emericellopsis atlantica TaxID=2614577 RepID=A0A9P8CRE5_9HYPO|nr:uncharacterized protein F5Z01DRAFT_748510 [Emericellopsis atlantica]KAG9256934.1 hypothetical protein F5Z01DRAFT_748510 [Emericellopsis atlantica]
MCGRCVRGGRLCGGYDDEGRAHDASTVLQPALRDGARIEREVERLSHLASLVMSLDRDNRPLQHDRVWGRPFLQFSHSVHCAKAAAAAFGAAYEALLKGHIPQDHPPTLNYYGSALRQLQASVDDGSATPESCAVASLMLSGVEILSQHEANSFMHFLGACQILDTKRQGSSSPTASGVLEVVEEELVLIGVAVGGYTMSQTPAFMHLEPQHTHAADDDDAFSRTGSAIKASAYALHRAYNFIGRSGGPKHRYSDYAQRDPMFLRDQADVLAKLGAVCGSLETLTERLEARLSTKAESACETAMDLAEVYALRSQVTTTLIFLLCMHSPFESAHDTHRTLFQSIISNAAASIHTKDRIKSSTFSRFTCRPGVLGPLFIVSTKCRDPSLRRLATSMLKEQGREGPADGRTMAVISARLTQLEESAEPKTGPHFPRVAADIQERYRIHGYSVDGPQLIKDNKRVIRVSFSMPCPPLQEGWGSVDYAKVENWSFRSEDLEL